MNKKPEISVIIPVYNEEKHLVEMLDCLARQTYKDFEIIVIDDGSTDNTWNVLQEYGNCLVKAYHQENQGQSAARNFAMEKASGKYIAFLDADDLISDNYLEKLYAAAVSNGAQVALCAYKNYIDGTDDIELIRIPSEWSVEFEPGYSHVFQYSSCQKIIRRDLIDKYGISFSAGELMEDVPYSLQINSLANKVATVDEIMYFHRIHGKSTMAIVREGKKDPKMSYKGMENAAKLFQSVETDKIRLDMFEYCFVKILTGFLTNMFCQYGKVVRKPFCDYCYRILGEYFPNVGKNPYIFGKKAKNIKKLPFSHRMAVKLFVISYKMHAIYAFSSVVSFFLRIAG